jgi:small subunit ribosomal protein S17
MPRKVYEGTVTRDSMDKTVTVEVVSLYQHPLYKKTVKRRLKLKAHDEKNVCKNGDRVKVVESSPISKTKSWTVVGKPAGADKEKADGTSTKQA